MRGVYQLFCFCLVHARDANLQIHLDTEAGRNFADPHRGCDGKIRRQGDLGLAGDELHCANEAGSITGCKQLFGIGA